MQTIIAAVVLGLVLVILTVALGRLFRRDTIHSLKPMQSIDDALPRIFRGPLALWTIMFTLACLMLLAVSGIMLFYAFAIFHGEVLLLLREIPLTAGNVVGHLCYPAIVLIMAIFLLVLFTGMTSTFLGKIPALGRIGLRAGDIAGMTRTLLMLLAVAAALEVVKIISLASINPSTQIARAFAGGQARIDPLPLAVVTVLLFVNMGLWLFWSGRR